jgi:hypothetical protein
MILGLHNFSDAVTHYFSDHVSPDHDPSLLLLDSILLIPLVFAVFFYPVEILLALAVVAVALGAFVGLARVLRRHRTHVGH